MEKKDNPSLEGCMYIRYSEHPSRCPVVVIQSIIAVVRAYTTRRPSQVPRRFGCYGGGEMGASQVSEQPAEEAVA